MNSSPQNQLSTAGTEDRVTTRVTVSACESAASRLGEASRTTTDVARPSPRSRKCLCPSRPLTANRCAARPPFRRRVSFSDATSVIDVGDDHCCRSTMQDDDDLASDRESESKAERETFYDIWQAADDSSAGRSDDGYSDSASRIVDNYAENRSCGVSGCALDSNKGRQSESIGEKRTIESDDVCPADRIAGGNKARSNEDDTAWNEDLSSSTRKNVDSIGRDDEYRMRGGCGGCCGGPAREKCSFWRSSQDYGCRCGGLAPEPSELCAPSTDRAKTVAPFSRSCCRCARICKKAARCEPPPCTTGVRSCDGGGCCGGGCCCGRSDKICASSPRIYSSPAHFSCGRSPCAPRCPSQSPCSLGACRSCCSRSNNCRRSRSPRCPSVVGSGSCGVNDGTKCGTDGACCRLRLPCECLGGGLDCRRCGRKVYQAEMQIASGAPYHNICFSCFCCRKPLEPLTYQENGGEIYCKQCYVRNFGPQGYGYGVGGGVLQTPL